MHDIETVLSNLAATGKAQNATSPSNKAIDISQSTLSVFWAEDDFCQWLLTESDTASISAALERTRSEFFEQSRNKAIVSVCLDIVNASGFNKNTNSGIELKEFVLKAKELKAQVGSTEDLAALINKANTNISFNEAIQYLDIVIDSFNKRRLHATLLKELEQLQSLSYPSAAQRLFDLAQSNISNSNLLNPQKEPEHISQPIGEMLSSLSGEKPINNVIPTGFRDIDQITTGGLRGGELVILAGRPGMGKTAFALRVARNIGFNCSDDEYFTPGAPSNVLFFSGEMGSMALASRIVSSESGVLASRLRALDKNKLQQDDFMRLNASVPQFAKNADGEHNIRFWIDDAPGMTLSHIKTTARDFVKGHGKTLIIVDYLQLIAAYSAREFGRRGDGAERQNVISTSNQLKALAKDLDCPVMALAQLNRSLEKRVNKVPILSDLREAGEIEQDADIIIFLYRDAVYNDEADINHAQAIIAKQRDGGTGVIELNYQPEYVRFSSIGFNR